MHRDDSSPHGNYFVADNSRRTWTHHSNLATPASGGFDYRTWAFSENNKKQTKKKTPKERVHSCRVQQHKGPLCTYTREAKWKSVVSLSKAGWDDAEALSWPYLGCFWGQVGGDTAAVPFSFFFFFLVGILKRRGGERHEMWRGLNLQWVPGHRRHAQWTLTSRTLQGRWEAGLAVR